MNACSIFAKLVIFAIAIMMLPSCSDQENGTNSINKKSTAPSIQKSPLITQHSKFAEFKKGIYTGMMKHELSLRYEIKQSYLGGNTFDIEQPELIDNRAKLIRVLFDNKNRAYEIIVNFGSIWNYDNLRDVLIGVYGEPNRRGGVLETIWINGDNIIIYKKQSSSQGGIDQIVRYENSKLSSLFDQYLSRKIQNDNKNKTRKDVKNWN